MRDATAHALSGAAARPDCVIGDGGGHGAQGVGHATATRGGAARIAGRAPGVALGQAVFAPAIAAQQPAASTNGNTVLVEAFELAGVELMSDARYRFLPWSRRGLAARVPTEDAPTKVLASRAKVSGRGSR